MKALATHVMKVCVPMYFNVKFYSPVAYGSALFPKFIRTTQCLPPNLKEIVNTVVINNAYFAHPESLY